MRFRFDISPVARGFVAFWPILLFFGSEPSLSQKPPNASVQTLDWGSIQSLKDGNGLTISILVNAATSRLSKQTSAQAFSGSIARLLRTFSVQPHFPRFAFYLAIPPNTTVRIVSTNVHTVAANPNDPIVISGYQSTNDSSGLVPVYNSEAQVGTIPNVPVIEVGGYEWYRGYRLARVGVSPYQQNGPKLGFADKITCRIEYGAILGVPVSGNNAPDPQFNVVLRKMVANADELSTIAQTRMVTNDTSGNWIPWGSPAIKLSIAEDGVYRITFQEVQSLVNNASFIDPTTFRLFNRGKEIPVYVAGEGDHQFSGNDYIEFPALRNYGLADYHSLPSGTQEYPEYLDRYTDTSAYWLTWGGSPGIRMDSTSFVPGSTDSLTWYTELAHVEQNNTLQFADGSNLVLRQDPRWTSGDIWGWDWLYAGGTFDVPFAVSEVSSAYPTATIFARGASATWPNGTPSYRVRLRLNGSDTLQKVDDTGQTPQILMQANAPISLLVNGSNIIHVQSLPTSSSVNQILFDWGEAQYPRNLVASGDTLIFGFPWLTKSGVRLIVVSDLANPDVMVYKFNPKFKRITNIAVSGSGPYTATFSDTLSPGDRYMVWGAAKVKVPQTAYVKSFPNFRDPSRRADYILITSRQFESIANSYASFIGSTYHLSTSVIDVDDIFNEFGYGYPTAESIRSFLKTTTGWQAPMPSYVFLVGDGTYDYKHYIANPNPANAFVASVPTYGEPVSDSWLAVLDDSSIVPQMFIGRLPVNTQDEFSRYFQRVQTYVAQRNDDWNKRYMFFAGGDPNTPGQIESFRQTNESIISSMINPSPIGGVASDFYKTSNPSSDLGPYTSDKIQNAIDKGAVFICYIGHSGTQTWDNGIGSITQLQNTRNRFPLITDFGCSTAKFAEPDVKCFGELFTLDPQGSAIAYVGNTALGFVSIALTLPPLFYKQFLVNQIYQIGKAHLLGKIEAMNAMGGSSIELNRVMMLTNSLLGDPSIELSIPKEPNISVSAGTISTMPALPSDDQDSLKLVIPYLNTGTVIQDSLKVDIQHTYNGVFADTSIWRQLPFFQDTVLAAYPVKGLAGDHTFAVQFNADGQVPEIQMDDNSARYSNAVLSTALQVVRPLPNYESPQMNLVFLNPVKRPSDPAASLILDVDSTKTFATPLEITQALGVITTTFPLPTLRNSKEYYWRAGFANSTNPKVRGSLVFGASPSTRWHPADSISWNFHIFESAKYSNGVGVTIAPKLFNLQVISAGFSDGDFGAVNINSFNVLTNTVRRGHNVVLFDTTDLSIKDVRTFDIYIFAEQSDSLANYLNALPIGSLVVDLIIDEGSIHLSASAISAIKSIGSAFIDSLGFRDSWAIFGRKGAVAGTVPEQWKKSFTGKAELDTVITRQVGTGTVESPQIGPVGTWKSATFSATTPFGASLTLSVLGIKKSGSIDTLLVGQTGSTINLAQFAPSLYPELKLLGILSVNSIGQSPLLSDWSVNLDLPAELAINYQSVTISADTVLEGADARIQAGVYNVGSVPADSVLVRLTSIGAYGLQTVDSVLLGTIVPDSFRTANFSFPTTGRRGSNTLFLEVDPEQRVNETYKSNNVMVLPLFVRSDTAHPTFTISVDGSPVYNGDYVSANPTILVDVFDSSPLPITNPTSVAIMMDDQPVTIGTYPDSLFEPRNGPDKALVTYRPRLVKGEHTLSVQVKDASGNFADTTARQVTFKVETDPGILNVYNYPNPFGHETQFTFNLVGSDLPDELKIKIYTIAGRLIQELTVWRSQLRIGFNRVPWDGRDRDGDELANGVYFYKVMMTVNGKSEEVIQKLAIVK